MARKFLNNQYCKLTVIERFLQKITINHINWCWEWQGNVINNSYGQFNFRGAPIYAHRFSYQYYIGEIEKGLVICHKCDNPKCVSPFHLFKGTHKDNTQDAINKGRLPDSKCPSPSRYRDGCRCEPCKQRQNEKTRRSRLNKKNRNKL